MPEPFFKQRRVYDDKYLAHVRTLRCCVCGNDVEVEAHHPRIAGTIANGDRVLAPGMGQKASDRWAVPLCGMCHRDLHARGEHEFWASLGIDPFMVAMGITYP